MRTRILGILLFALSLTLLARARSPQSHGGQGGQDDEKVVRASLPAAWNGVFEGKLEVLGEDGKVVATSPLSLEIGATAEGGARPFKLTTDPTSPAHEWELVPVDGSSNKFLNDQKNGVSIDVYLAGDTLYSQYEISGGHYDSRITLTGDSLLYEIVDFGTIAQRSTQSSSVTPPLRSFPLVNVQRAFLKRS